MRQRWPGVCIAENDAAQNLHPIALVFFGAMTPEVMRTVDDALLSELPVFVSPMVVDEGILKRVTRGGLSGTFRFERDRP